MLGDTSDSLEKNNRNIQGKKTSAEGAVRTHSPHRTQGHHHKHASALFISVLIKCPSLAQNTRVSRKPVRYQLTDLLLLGAEAFNMNY